MRAEDLLPLALLLVIVVIFVVAIYLVAARLIFAWRFDRKSIEKLRTTFEQDLPATGVTVFAVEELFFRPPSLVAVNLDNELSTIYRRNGKIQFEPGLQSNRWVMRAMSISAGKESTRYLTFRRSELEKAVKHTFSVLTTSEQSLPEPSFKKRRVVLKNGALVNGVAV